MSSLEEMISKSIKAENSAREKGRVGYREIDENQKPTPSELCRIGIIPQIEVIHKAINTCFDDVKTIQAKIEGSNHCLSGSIRNVSAETKSIDESISAKISTLATKALNLSDLLKKITERL